MGRNETTETIIKDREKRSRKPHQKMMHVDRGYMIGRLDIVLHLSTLHGFHSIPFNMSLTSARRVRTYIGGVGANISSHKKLIILVLELILVQRFFVRSNQSHKNSHKPLVQQPLTTSFPLLP